MSWLRRFWKGTPRERAGDGVARIGGRYRVDRELSRGDTASVLLCVDERLASRRVVVKILRGSVAPDDGDRQAWTARHFEDECELLATLSHPNVVSLVDRGVTPDGKPYLVTAFVEGTTLRAALQPGGLELGRAAAILRQLGDALTHVHAHGIVHRDLKPENILLHHTSDGRERATIVDFGLASIRSGTGGPDSVEPTRVAGTIPYMAPEQFEGAPSAASDTYALGVIAHEMLTGRRPFNPDNPFQMPALQKRGLLDPPSAFRPDLPREAEEAIVRALAFDPAARPSPPRALTDRICDALTGASPIRAHEQFSVESEEPPPSGLAPAGGALPVDSQFYVVRDADGELAKALGRGDATVLVKGARQVGKTSLLGRGLHAERAAGARVACVDLQRLSASDLASSEAFYRVTAEMLCDQIGASFSAADWDSERSANRNFERFVRRRLLDLGSGRLVLALDEADRLFPYEFASEVFGLFRSWHNARGLEPGGPWHRLTLVIVYATEAHLFTADSNQSPFNVGTQIDLADFTAADLDDLDRRYGAPLGSHERRERLRRLVGGHPFLVQRSFEYLTMSGHSLEELEAAACHDDGPFGRHLRRLISIVSRDADLGEAVRRLLLESAAPPQDLFYRLRSGGLLAGETPRQARFRSGLYEVYLREHLPG